MPSYTLESPQFVAGVLDSMIWSPTRYIATDQWFPITNSKTDQILIDFRRPQNYGLTKPAVPGEESKHVYAGGIKQRLVTPGHFQEAAKLTRNDLIAIRKLGTLDQVEDGREILARKIRWLAKRAKDRMEWLGFQALQGSITVNEGGINYTVTFPLAPEFTPTAGVLWTNPITATPIDDLRTWSQLGAAGHGFLFTKAYMNRATYNVAVKTNKFDTLFNSTAAGWSVGQMPKGMRSADLANDLMRRYMQDVPQIVIHDEGYHLETQNTAQMTAGTATAVVNDAANFAVGNSVTIESASTDSLEIKTIQSIVGNTITFTANLTNTYPVGSSLNTFKRFIADGKVLLMPEAMPGANEDVGKIGKFFMTPNEFGPNGSLMKPAPGIFSEVQIHDTNSDPKYAAVIGGFSGMAAVLFKNAHVFATVF